MSSYYSGFSGASLKPIDENDEAESPRGHAVSLTGRRSVTFGNRAQQNRSDYPADTGQYRRVVRHTGSADEEDELTSDVVPGGYGSVDTDGNTFANSQRGSRSSAGYQQGTELGVDTPRTSTASRVKARLRHRQIKAKN